jgi:hypothetical protein
MSKKKLMLARVDMEEYRFIMEITQSSQRSSFGRKFRKGKHEARRNLKPLRTQDRQD